jgi:hypothetical protein
LDGPRREVIVPSQGFYVAELNNGSVTTIIEGKTQHRSSGDLWSVAAGKVMVVQTERPSQQNIVLRILSVKVVE